MKNNKVKAIQLIPHKPSLFDKLIFLSIIITVLVVCSINYLYVRTIGG